MLLNLIVHGFGGCSSTLMKYVPSLLIACVFSTRNPSMACFKNRFLAEKRPSHFPRRYKPCGIVNTVFSRCHLYTSLRTEIQPSQAAKEFHETQLKSRHDRGETKERTMGMQDRVSPMPLEGPRRPNSRRTSNGSVSAGVSS